MFYNNVKLAIRSLRRRPVYSIVIILSLAFGLSFSNILIGFIIRETYTDTFHPNHERVYRLLSNDPFGYSDKISYILESSAAYVEEHFPEVEALCRMFELNSQGVINELSKEGVVLEANEQAFAGNIVLAADSNFFQLFDFPFYQGKFNQALRPGSILLSKSTATKLFGETHVIGQSVAVIRDSVPHSLTVTGVIDDVHENSHLQFDGLVGYNEFENYTGGTLSYLLLRPSGDADALAEKISQDTDMPALVGNGTSEFMLQPLPEVYFDQENTRNFTHSRSKLLVNIGWVVAGLILFIAAFNFINLFVTSLLERSKEFGVKKLLGALDTHMRRVIVAEVSIFIFAALLISLASTAAALPYFSQTFHSTLDLSYLLDIKVIGFFSLIILMIGLIVSATLFTYTQRIKPLNLLQKNSSAKPGFNKLLFTFQFVIAVALICSSAMIIKQIEYIKNKPLGFSREIIEVRAPSDDLAGQLQTLKQDLMRHGTLTRISLGTNPLTSNMIVRQKLNEEEFYSPFLLHGDEDLLSTLGLELIEGQSLNAHHQKGVLVNEKFVKYFAMEEPLQASIPGSEDEVIRGVIKDFNSVSLKREIPEYIISYEDSASSLLVNYAGIGLEVALPILADAWSKVFPHNSFEYSLIEDRLLSRHEEDFFFFRIIIAFSLASVLITCFGLFALAWGGTQRRTKEIAIRKTVGASVLHITQLLSWSFVKWVLLAFLIAVPITYIAIDYWLQSFAFRTTMSWWVYALAGIVAIAITLLTVGFQTIKAALANPVKSLRYD